MNKPKILGLKLKKKGVEVSYIDRRVNDDDTIVEVEVTSLLHVEPHQDLKDAVAQLSTHFAQLTEQEEYPARVTEDAVAHASGRFPVRGIGWKYTKNAEGVQLHGHRVLSNGYVVNMLARKVQFNSEAEDYPQADQLQEIAMLVEAEVVALLDGKSTAPAQTSILDSNQRELEEQPAEQDQ